MSLPPSVSVVLPTFNRAPTLARAIESVLSQTFNDFELIIVDDRSTDDTHEIFGRYTSHDKIRIISQLASGCSVARNIGVSVSRGRYVAFQDSDDEWTPDKLEKAVAALDGSSPDVAVFYSDMLRIQQNGDQFYWRSPDIQKGVLINEQSLDYQVACIGIQSAVIKRECFCDTGMFDERLPRFIDLELFIRLSDRFEFIHCREPLVRYYAGKGISTDTRAQVIARNYLVEKYRRRLESNTQHLAAQELQIKIATQEDESATISGLLSEREGRIRRTNKSLAGRALSWYGRNIKYPYLIPIYKLLGLYWTDPSKLNGQGDSRK
ncbi:MAG TPA: glycosyltransferase [Blastocatellia bacterium]|nr:glycosyltransferase [Blastocatellia bacterium]